MEKITALFKNKLIKMLLILIAILTVLALKEYITAKNKPSIDEKIIRDRRFHTAK